MSISRRAFLGAVTAGGITALAGCLNTVRGRGINDSGTATPDQVPDTTDGAGLPLSEGILPVEYTFDELRDRTVSGGPPKDGIPSIDEPEFLPANEVGEFLAPDDVVFGVVRGGEVKAYPQKVLVWHEIVNDELGGNPVSVTYCPLTGTTLGFERGDTTFGVSGRLVNSNLVMYDRATDSRWPQVLATAVSGPFEGRHLREFPVAWTTWRNWKSRHPDTLVLSDRTGFGRNYGHDPYGSYNPIEGYYSNSNTLFAPLARDDRFPAKEVVVGARGPEGSIAFRKERLRETGLLTGSVDGIGFLAVADPGLDGAAVYRNPDGRSFEFRDGTAVDTDTGEGVADGGNPLERVMAFDAMWFAWFGFYPGTAVVA